MAKKRKPERSKKSVSRRDFLVASGEVIAAGAFTRAQTAQAVTTALTSSRVPTTKTVAATVTGGPVTAAAIQSVPTTTAASTISGTYTAASQGFGGIVTTTVTLANNLITQVTAEGPNETPDRGGAALKQVPAAIAAANSTKVDVISGATMTSNAILRNVDSILQKADLVKAPAAINMKTGTYVGKAKLNS